MLDSNHPGFRDPEYRNRRDQIAESARAYKYPSPVPWARYTEDENSAWQRINTLLSPLHSRNACDLYLRMRDSAALDRNYIPQLDAINIRLERATGFQLSPVAGLVNPRSFLSTLAEGRMLCTQYIRHHSAPLYTPEPDIVHELLGHVVMFFDPAYCQLNREIGEAARVLSDDSLLRLERLYWYSVEFGLVVERGVTRAFGAGLLSSAGELGSIEAVPSLPFKFESVVSWPYDTTHMQRTLFRARSIDEMYAEIRNCIQDLRRRDNV